MVNVCLDCLRLNPLGNKKCYYCQGVCEEMSAQRLSELMLQKNNAKEEHKEEQIEIEK